MREKRINNMKLSENTIVFFAELKKRIVWALVLTLLLFIPMLFYANNLYDLLAWPLIRYLPEKQLIATEIGSPFFIPFKLSFFLAFILAAPFFLYQIWAFVAPALYSTEKKLFWLFLVLSSVLFYLGLVFAYFIIFPLIFHFLAGCAPKAVRFSPDISAYFDFASKILILFGLLFEIPIVMVMLIQANVVNLLTFKKMRSYAIVAAFILGMLFAPPDVLSQTILAVPIWLLYEFGLLLGKFCKS